MEQYHGLKYKTLGNASPQGKSRVYFCCHPDDFARLFGPVTDEVLSMQRNAAIYYYDASENIPSGEAFLADLSQMQLFVIPVTWKFIYQESSARMLELAYAQEHHIPVLPLMQEDGLDSDFNRVCGDIQYLSKHNSMKDATAIPYEEKLRKYLESVLVSDELAEQIRRAFDAYIFLSYRKKDRKYAQEIMHLIHENDFCRDIAIWYDEFLTPGENFNEAIVDAMEKSQLFALVVTPNLLESPNYVMTTEYPQAKKASKQILPIEALETDDEEMKKKYQGIPSKVSVGDKDGVADLLRESLGMIARQEQNHDPKHLFFIGLAYLSGIDVEVDHQKAFALIEAAANQGLPEAYEKLVSMYNTGEGVERDYHAAVIWQETYVEALERMGKNTFDALWDLGNMLYDLGQMEKAREAYQRMREQSRNDRELSVTYNHLGRISQEEGKLTEANDYYLRGLQSIINDAEETGTIRARIDVCISYILLGNVSYEEGEMPQAKGYFLRGMELGKSLNEEIESIEVKRYLSYSYGRLGDVSLHEGKLSEAKDYFLKNLRLCRGLAEETGTVQARTDLSDSLRRIADLSRAEGKLNQARYYYLRNVEVRKEIAEETETIEARRFLAVGYQVLGDFYQIEEYFKGAKEYYLKNWEITKGLAEDTGTVKARRDLSISYRCLGDISKEEGKLPEAKEHYLRGCELSKGLVEEVGTIDLRGDLAIIYERLGDVSQAEGNLAEAKEFYRSDMEITKGLAEETGTIELRIDLSGSYIKLGKVSQAEGNLTEAKEFYLKSLDISKDLAEETGMIEMRRELCVSYIKIGDISQAEGNLAEAKEYYQKGSTLSERLVEETSWPQVYADLGAIYIKLGSVGDVQMYEKAYDIFKKLAVRFPENVRYQSLRDDLKELLT